MGLLSGRNYGSNIGKLSLSNAMLWRSSIDHGENHEPGKSRCTTDKISRAIKYMDRRKEYVDLKPAIRELDKIHYRLQQRGQGMMLG